MACEHVNTSGFSRISTVNFRHKLNYIDIANPSELQTLCGWFAPPFGFTNGNNSLVITESHHFISSWKESRKKVCAPSFVVVCSLSCLFYDSSPARRRIPIKFIMNTGAGGWQELNGSKSYGQSNLGWRWSTSAPPLCHVFLTFLCYPTWFIGDTEIT